MRKLLLLLFAGLLITGARLNHEGAGGGAGTGDIEAVTAGAGLTGGGTTGSVTLDVGAGTAMDINADDIAWDSTEVEATTWGAGGNASNIWTFNLSGTDPTLTAGSGLLTVGGALTATGLVTGSANVTIGNGVSAGTLTLLEGTGGGTNFKAFAAPAAITADTTCTFENDANFIPDSCVGNGTDDGGAEVNNLETITTGIASTEIPIGTAADTVVYAALSGQATMTNGGVVTVSDLTCTGCLGTTEIAGLDISADTNLTAGDNLTLTDDDLDLDAAVTIATSIASPIFASTTAGVAAAGILRFANAEGINWEAAPAGTDCTLLTDASEVLTSSCVFTATGGVTLDANTEANIEAGVDLAGEVTAVDLDSTVIADSVTVTGWVLGTSSATTLTAGTVNIDLLDAVGAVDMDYGSVDVTDHTFVTDSTGTAEIVLPAGSIDSTEVLNDTLVAADLNSAAAIALSQTAMTAGRSLTISTNDVLADVELYTDLKVYRLPYPTGADDDKSIWIAPQATTITAIWCETDATNGVVFDLQVDDGTPTGVNGSDITCSTTMTEDATLAGDATMAAGDRLDLVITSVASVPTWVSIGFEITYDD